MKSVQEAAVDLIEWCKGVGIDHEVMEFDRSPASRGEMRSLVKYHSELEYLYKDSNEIAIKWGFDSGYNECGLMKIESAEECLDQLEGQMSMTNDWSDDEILESCHDARWWKPRLPLFRSMVKFYDEGNGDYMALSTLDNAVYFVFHDWMDWISEEPPIIKLADNIVDLVNDWSSVRFACPKNLYWMSAVSNGNFTGFNQLGFAVKGDSL